MVESVEAMDPRWQHPFTCVIAGPTSCGKTVFVKRLIAHHGDMITPPCEEIIWCYGEWQASYEDLRGVVKFHEGLPDLEEWDVEEDEGKEMGIGARRKRRLLILDDLMKETDARVTSLFTKGSHHRNMSVIHIVQNLFGKNKEQRTISLNSHYLVVFKNPRDASQITHLAKQMYPGNIKYLQEAYKDATAQAHGYLLIDLKQSTPEHLRLRTAIFPGTQQTVYVQK